MNGKRPGGWVALAWRYYRDEKILAVSADAELLWAHALAFTGEQNTDGRVPATALGVLSSKLLDPPVVAAAELVASGLWVRTEGGWAFASSWQAWQQTADQAAASRVRNAKRRATSREQGERRTDPGTDPGTDRRSHKAILVGGEVGHRPIPLHPPATAGLDRISDVRTWEDRGYLFASPDPGEPTP